MTTFEFPGPERRRSVRTQLAVPVRVCGLTRSGEEFTAEAPDAYRQRFWMFDLSRGEPSRGPGAPSVERKN